MFKLHLSSECPKTSREEVKFPQEQQDPSFLRQRMMISPYHNHLQAQVGPSSASAEQYCGTNRTSR
jgi:hypothetical protein